MPSLQEDDFSLIHALQVRPRASWTDLAPALNSSPATLSRRWERLYAEGSAWVTGYPRVHAMHGPRLAIVEISCASGRANAVGKELATWPAVVTVGHAARGYDLIVTTVGHDDKGIPRLLLDDLSGLPDVLGVRAHHVVRFQKDARTWRVGGLDRDQAQAVARTPQFDGDTSAVTGGAAAVNPWVEPYASIATALSEDGRRSAAELARQIDRPLSTTRRQLGQLLKSGALTFRCEVAQGLTPFPVIMQWWCQAPVARVADLVNRPRAVSWVRQVASLPGPTNLLITTWTGSIESSMQIHECLERDLAPLAVVETAVILRQTKRLGWVLDEHGRRTSTFVPYAPHISREV